MPAKTGFSLGKNAKTHAKKITGEVSARFHGLVKDVRGSGEGGTAMELRRKK
jgi:hypothetical protein